MQRNSNKPKIGLLGFVFKYKIALIFFIIFISLFKQNILINGFPMVINDRQNMIDTIVAENARIEEENQVLKKQISDYRDGDLTLLESQARYKYGLVKDGETYYQINAIIETDNSNETSIIKTN